MKNRYRNYNQEDLIVAHLSMVNHTGKINEEIREAIHQKFNYDEFVNKANQRILLIKEKNRISFEVHNLVQKGNNYFFIMENISSTILNNEELEDFIIQKFHTFSDLKKNNTIDGNIIFKAFWGFSFHQFLDFLFFKSLFKNRIINLLEGK